MDYVEAHKRESWGDRLSTIGIHVEVALHRELTAEDRSEISRLAEQMEEKLLRRSYSLDPEQKEIANGERRQFLDLFPEPIYVQEVPNRYCSRSCCSMRPWYQVTTTAGIFEIGWRKNVIAISWAEDVAPKADVVFPVYSATKFDRTVHAWGYAAAKDCIAKILAAHNAQPVAA